MDNLSFDNREGYIWYNGNLIEWKNANVHVLNHGLHYASCVFEGERAYRGKIFETEKHTKRLFNSAKSLDMIIPFSEKEVIEAKDILLHKNSRISSTRRHPAIRTSCVGPMGLVLKLGLVKTQGVMYCIYRV